MNRCQQNSVLYIKFIPSLARTTSVKPGIFIINNTEHSIEHNAELTPQNLVIFANVISIIRKSACKPALE